jgi:hypothetical protein
MSVQVNTYVMEGVLFEYAALEDRYEDFEPYMDSAFEGIKHKDGICVLFDGMNGDYVAIGRVIAKTENGQHFETGPITITPSTSFESQVELSLAISRLVGHGVTLRYMVISHYR